MVTAEQHQAMVDGIATIKNEMPGVYRQIEEKVREIGPSARGLVRRGLRGEPGCFWACERGFVVGTPFAGLQIQDDVAAVMVNFGCAHVCIWGTTTQEAAHGAD